MVVVALAALLGLPVVGFGPVASWRSAEFSNVLKMCHILAYRGRLLSLGRVPAPITRDNRTFAPCRVRVTWQETGLAICGRGHESRYSFPFWSYEFGPVPPFAVVL